MKNKVKLSFLLAVSVLLLSNAGFAENYIQLSLLPTAQLVPENESISGLRLCVYGKNTSLQGLDFGLVCHLTKPSVGFQHSIVGYNESDFSGWQENFVSIVKGNFTGLQGGAYTESKKLTGIQYGFINIASSVEGLQYGIYNQADNLKGIQIGLINVIKNNGFMPLFPIVNWSL